MSILRVEGVGKDFMERTVLQDITFSIEPGESVGLIGPNGAGKTTLVNLITGYLVPDRGQVWLNGVKIERFDPHRISTERIRRTFQLTRNFGRMSVLENVLVAATAAGIGVQEARRDAMELLEQFSIGQLADEPASSLSGGQQKLLELAACFIVDPHLVILDEPFAAVHPTIKEIISDHIAEQNRLGRTFLIVSHDLPAFHGITPRLVAMGAGRVLADGALQEVLDHPAVVESYLGGEAWLA